MAQVQGKGGESVALSRTEVPWACLQGEQGRGGISRALFRGPSFSDKRSSSLPGSVISQLARRQALAELPTIAVHHSSIGEAPPGSCVAISSELPLLAAPGKTLTQRGAGIDVDMEGTQAGWPAGKGAWISGTGSGTRTPSAAESLSLFESEMGAPTGPADGADEMMLDPSGQSGPRRPMKVRCLLRHVTRADGFYRAVPSSPGV